MIQVYHNGHQGEVRICNKLSGLFEISAGLKQRDALSPLLSNLVLEFVIRRKQISNEVLNFNGLLQVLAYADDLYRIGETREILAEYTKLLLDTAKEVGREANEDKIDYMENNRLNKNNNI